MGEKEGVLVGETGGGCSKDPSGGTCGRGGDGGPLCTTTVQAAHQSSGVQGAGRDREEGRRRGVREDGEGSGRGGASWGRGQTAMRMLPL